MKTWIVIIGVLAASGCVSVIDLVVKDYAAVADRIELGQSVDHVLQILEPTQVALPAVTRKQPDRYIKEGEQVLIYYARSGNQLDGLTTDDEFTPYVFVDGTLKAIGWATLGGPRTQGQAAPETHIHVTQPYYGRRW
jgi:hypothetical protein